MKRKWKKERLKKNTVGQKKKSKHWKKNNNRTLVFEGEKKSEKKVNRKKNLVNKMERGRLRAERGKD